MGASAPYGPVHGLAYGLAACAGVVDMKLNPMRKVITALALMALAGCSRPMSNTGRDMACQAYKNIIAMSQEYPVIDSDLRNIADAAERMDNLGCAK